MNLSLGTFAPGIHKGIPFADYLAIPAINKSSLMCMQESPLAFRMSMLGELRKDSSGFALGTALDDLVTGGMTDAAFSAAHPPAHPCSAVLKSGTRKGAQCGCEAREYAGGWFCGKHSPDDSPASEPGLTSDEVKACFGMRDALRSSPCRLLLDGCKGNQITVLWHDQETGLPCKARLDGWSACQLPGAEQAESVHWDLKTTRETTPHGFGRAANDLGYWLQQAHYLSGCAALDALAGREPITRRFVFAVAQSVPSMTGHHAAYLWEYSDIAGAEAERAHLMRKVKACMDANRWPSVRVDGIQVGTLPDWKLTHRSEQ